MSDDRSYRWLDLKRRLVEATRLFEIAEDIQEKATLGTDVRELERLAEIAANEIAGSAASEKSMTDYRAYIIGLDGHFKNFEIIIAQTTRRRSRPPSNSSMVAPSKSGSSTGRSPCCPLKNDPPVETPDPAD